MTNEKITLITLNAWGGREMDALADFFRRRGPETDIFCLQEMFDSDQALQDARHPDFKLTADVFRRVQELLPGHMGCLAYFDDDQDRMTLAMFVRHGLAVRTVADFIVHRPDIAVETGSTIRSARKLQYATIRLNGRDVTVANFHGLWINGPKSDTPERIVQSNRVRKFLDGVSGGKVLCGDFNLMPETESVAILAKGMRNHVAESGVAGTRTKLYRHIGNPAESKFADYVFTSPDVNVESFEVLPDVVSDHAALRIVFS
jgi:endonuclease/exonuclease/phosphatase family metal-dependent hydrolase